MIPVAELQQRLDELRRVRSEGRRSITYKSGRVVTYGSDAELAAAIGDLERQLASATGTPVHTIRIAASKGLEENA